MSPRPELPKSSLVDTRIRRRNRGPHKPDKSFADVEPLNTAFDEQRVMTGEGCFFSIFLASRSWSAGLENTFVVVQFVDDVVSVKMAQINTS